MKIEQEEKIMETIIKLPLEQLLLIREITRSQRCMIAVEARIWAYENK